MTKIVQLVNNCAECPKRMYYSGGKYQCMAVGETLPEDHRERIPGWCHLAEYPAGIAGVTEAPVGYKLVPLEPTEEMAYRGGEATAGRIEWDDAPDDAPDQLARAIYRAMLNAAPPGVDLPDGAKTK